ncbi:MAG: tRNA preQ1(34) S-adenosylmethionine ribosyltransferase-isomerase QueA [Sphaerospermopsis sp. SIO1G2]|nr:tRNA preQ1(34) S-adenosylmethionine ribosyltransferase-isomerase QueA [Sphaerospermopsis sp. SIO1G2]
MDLSLFDFNLPEHCIAQNPASKRDGAKLLHVTNHDVQDLRIPDIVRLFNEQDVLVLNDTRVIPARLLGKRETIDIEILLHKQLDDVCWRVFAKPAKRLRVGQRIIFSPSCYATVIEKYASGEIKLQFDVKDGTLWQAIQQLGEVPLPPYIARPDGVNTSDASRYQTVYAKHHGSVAAPTAGLHFTQSLLESLASQGVTILYVTLHVGGGTFLPVKVQDTNDHVMHSEYGELSEDVAEALNHARIAGKRIVAVGTTSLRILESTTDEAGIVHPFRGETDIFITPGYQFRCVDRLLTNFHLPKSTLFMLVSAFAGLSTMHSAYQHAINSDYRFYSYGDACLLEKELLG